MPREIFTDVYRGFFLEVVYGYIISIHIYIYIVAGCEDMWRLNTFILIYEATSGVPPCGWRITDDFLYWAWWSSSARHRNGKDLSATVDSAWCSPVWRSPSGDSHRGQGSFSWKRQWPLRMSPNVQFHPQVIPVAIESMVMVDLLHRLSHIHKIYLL